MKTSNNNKMDRVTFLKNLGLSSAAIFTATFCAGSLSSCSDDSTVADPKPVTPNTNNLVLDLNSATYSKLKTKGEFVVVNKIVVANTSDGTYVAVPLRCSHQGQEQITYRVNKFVCTAHGAEFDNSGKGLNANGNGGLAPYKVTLSGNTLTVVV
jgi:cytochrome b6-f complex iron-sulfur subunit